MRPADHIADRLPRISPFRWRLEWVLLLGAAAALVLGEQAREARTREPAAILVDGISASAHIIAARELQQSIRISRSETRQVALTLVDLEWRDSRSEVRRVADFQLANHIAADLGIDPAARRWPERVRIIYLDRPVGTALRTGANAEAVLPRDPVGRPCRPAEHCALVVLDASGRSSAHEEIERIELLLAYAPLVLWFCLAAFIGMLASRWLGVIDNRPTLE